LLTGLIIGWFATVVLVVIVEMATGTDTGSVGQLVALVGGIGLAVLVARLVPRGSAPVRWPSRPLDPKEHPNRAIQRG
jgi:hypothetical protein